jgi:hypothetical protein
MEKIQSSDDALQKLMALSKILKGISKPKDPVKSKSNVNAKGKAPKVWP